MMMMMMTEYTLQEAITVADGVTGSNRVILGVWDGPVRCSQRSSAM
jgi:hypothetical protein